MTFGSTTWIIEEGKNNYLLNREIFTFHSTSHNYAYFDSWSSEEIYDSNTRDLLIERKVKQDMFPKFAYTIYLWSKEPEYLLWISVSICVLAVVIYPVAATVIYMANGGEKLRHMTNIGGALQLKYVDNNDSGKVKFRGWVVFIMTLVGFVFTNFL